MRPRLPTMHTIVFALSALVLVACLGGSDTHFVGQQVGHPSECPPEAPYAFEFEGAYICATADDLSAPAAADVLGIPLAPLAVDPTLLCTATCAVDAECSSGQACLEGPGGCLTCQAMSVEDADASTTDGQADADTGQQDVQPELGPEPSEDASAAAETPTLDDGGVCFEISPVAHIGPWPIDWQHASHPVHIYNCGEEDLEFVSIELDPEGSPKFWVNEDPNITAMPYSIAPGQQITNTVAYLPGTVSPSDATGAPIWDLSEITVTIGNAFVQETKVPVSAYGIENVCPVPAFDVVEGTSVVPPIKLHLDTSSSWGSVGISHYDFDVEQPPGSLAALKDYQSAPTLEANVAGTYQFTLGVYDWFGVQSCETVEKTVYAVPDAGIHVELMWDTPGAPWQNDTTDNGPGADLDLHLKAPGAAWFDLADDCFWANEAPNWGEATAEDDPVLLRSDSDGWGPEVLRIQEPTASGAPYSIGVHYRDDNGWGESFATVRVYIYGALVFQMEDVLLMEGDFWEFATIDWPSGAITPAGDSPPMIIADYPVPELP